MVLQWKRLLDEYTVSSTVQTFHRENSQICMYCFVVQYVKHFKVNASLFVYSIEAHSLARVAELQDLTISKNKKCVTCSSKDQHFHRV